MKRDHGGPRGPTGGNGRQRGSHGFGPAGKHSLGLRRIIEDPSTTSVVEGTIRGHFGSRINRSELWGRCSSRRLRGASRSRFQSPSLGSSGTPWRSSQGGMATSTRWNPELGRWFVDTARSSRVRIHQRNWYSALRPSRAPSSIYSKRGGGSRGAKVRTNKKAGVVKFAQSGCGASRRARA